MFDINICWSMIVYARQITFQSFGLPHSLFRSSTLLVFPLTVLGKDSTNSI